MKPTATLVLAAFPLLSSAWQPGCAQNQAAVIPVNAVSTSSAAELRHFVRQSGGADSPAIPVPPETPGMGLVTGGNVAIGTAPERVEKLGQKDPIYMVEILAEVPRHTGKVDDFLMDLTEVTNLQWQVYLDATGRKPTQTLIDINWPDGKIPAGFEQHPITNVNIFELREYLEWCGKHLPTEAEWMRAARGDTENDFPWAGKFDSKLCRSGMDSTGHAEPVGTFPGGESPFHMLDMAGNVYEWVDTKFTPYDGFAPMTIVAAKKERQLIPEFASNMYVVKGGNFQRTSTFARIDARAGLPPMSSGEAVGFRAARSTHPGVDSIRHALRHLQPAQLVDCGVDEKDCFGREELTYDDARKVITGYRSLAFAHRGPEKGPGLTKLRTTSIDEPAALGVLYTTEALKMPDMKKSGAKNDPALPPGSYLLSFKGKGESKAHKEKRRTKKDGDKPEPDSGDQSTEKPGSDEPAKSEKDKDTKGKAAKDDKKDKKDKEDESKSGEEVAPGAAVPWPGVSSVHTATEDIEFPQDDDLILFINDNNAVVGWARNSAVEEVDLKKHDEESSDEKRTWKVDFSLDQMTGKRGPRFHLEFELAGPGI